MISVFVQIFTFLQGGLTARLLGPEGRGQLALIVIIPTLIASIGMVGVGRVIAREVVSGYEKLPSSLLLISFLSTIGMLFGVFFILFFYSEIKGEL
ncbi:MAG: oligosaccharide flippase family protein, partial [Sedimentisphaerales bacterium]|nr:oligosaccharide flippase family protein [Sedimentisphaerales bacterium]